MKDRTRMPVKPEECLRLLIEVTKENEALKQENEALKQECDALKREVAALKTRRRAPTESPEISALVFAELKGSLDALRSTIERYGLTPGAQDKK